jgi:hypothetical protein
MCISSKPISITAHLFTWRKSGDNNFKLGARHKVRDERMTYFLLDWWTGRGPLRASFPNLFACCDNQYATVPRDGESGYDDRSGWMSRWNEKMFVGFLTFTCCLQEAMRCIGARGIWTVLYQLLVQQADVGGDSRSLQSERRRFHLRSGCSFGCCLGGDSRQETR